MQRTGVGPAGKFILSFVVIFALLLAACGGGDDDDDDAGGETIPVVSGAERIHAADAPDDDVESFGGTISDGRTLVFTTDKSPEDVVAFYTNSLPEGWGLEANVPSGDMSIVMIHKGNTAAAAIIGSGSVLRESGLFTEDEIKDMNIEDVDDGETAIVIAEYTCSTLQGSECAQAIMQ